MALACTSPRMVAVMRARELGTSRAPAAPCAARATMSISGSMAPATAIDEMPKAMRPMRITTTRP
ncbi:Uncharacterised protein [Mycobacterium tuberculosis]|nr:Uncharacterised protein [Mycobacterium tuberculosis]